METINKLKNYLIKILILFLIGGTIYYCTEMLCRGHSHYSMFILGGIDFLLIGAINEYIDWNMKLLHQAIIGSGIITITEFITGYIVNLKLHLEIWDYSNLPLNILGQICLPFSLLWIAVSLLAIILDDYIRYWIFDEEKPHYNYKI